MQQSDAPRLDEVVLLPAATALERLATSPNTGLSRTEAERRLARYGANEVRAEERGLRDIVAEDVRSGFNVLLAAAGVLTVVIGDLTDGAIILGLLAVNIGLSVFQEYRAERALAALRALLPLELWVVRDGTEVRVPATSLVPGDLVVLASGDLIPADGRVIESDRLTVDQSTLTGESVPQAKTAEQVAGGPVASWANAVFAGTSVVSGRGRELVVATGARTQFGQAASLIGDIRAPGDFEKNLTRFGGLLLRFGLAIAFGVFAVNALLGRGVVESLTLAIAIALGLVPEALPAVTATSLALGGRALARRHILLRRLAAVEDLSVVDTLCSDKTGTITENRTSVSETWSEVDRPELLRLAVLATAYPSHDADIVDQAIAIAAEQAGCELGSLGAIPRQTVLPFSSESKRTVVVATLPDGPRLVVKGTASVVLARCATLRAGAGDAPIEPRRAEVAARVDHWQRGGARVLAVADAPVAGANPETVDDRGLRLIGLLALADPPRAGAAAALARAAAMAVDVKILTGDTLERAAGLAEQIGIPLERDVLVDTSKLNDAELASSASRGRVFGNMVPKDKLRLVQTLQQRGRHVAVTGDGVNDAPALKAADVGIAIGSGSDVAKMAADAVLLNQDLGVIVDGFAEGRRLFTNINHYLLYTMVSNFANVAIVAVASVFLPFLPLTPEQVLTLNVLADLPMLALVSDRVSAADIARPRRWELRPIMLRALALGVVNAFFAFGLLFVLRGRAPEVVHSVWFLFLGVSALLVLLAVRSREPSWAAPRLSGTLAMAMAGALAATLLLVNLPAAQQLLGFAPLDALLQLGLVAFAALYVLVADAIKLVFVRFGAPTLAPAAS